MIEENEKKSRLDFRNNWADGDGLPNDAYEFLLRQFATEWGNRKGQGL